LSSSDNPVIRVDGVSISYRVASIKVTTLKETLLRKLRGELRVSERTVLHEIDFQAKKGECVALVGHNGCGKSTLLKVIAGILTPRKGTVTTTGRLAPLIELGAGFDPELSGRENVFLNCSLMGLTKGEIAAKMPWIEAFSEIGSYFDAPIKTYSSGMHMRLGFSCAMAVDADTLLIDEILAVGDINFQKKCTTLMHEVRHSGTTIILVSHDNEVVRRLADRVLVIDEGHKQFEGNPGEALAFYDQLMEKKALASRSHAERAEAERKKKLRSGGGPLGSKARLMQAEVDGGTPLSDVPSGGTAYVRILFEVFSELEQDPTVGFAIHDFRGIRITGGNTSSLGGDSPRDFRRPGRYTASFELRDFVLAPGEYRLIAAIHDKKLETTLDFDANANTFKVVDATRPHNFDHDLVSPHHMLTSLGVEKVVGS
jgi:ABC-type polysaccharide/polyol phosphate transport system ATPase subunit